MSDNGIFIVEKKDHVAWLTFNRPEKRNTMTVEVFAGLIRLFGEFDDDPDVRVVVMKAEGKSFNAGLDLVEAGGIFSQNPGVDEREETRRKIMIAQDSNTVIEKCRKPVIAAIHSHCIGAGVDLTSACDIRMASEDAVFSIRETRMALVADLGTLQRVPYIIGEGRFRELAFTGRDFGAAEALEIGYVTHVLKDRESLYAKAGELAAEIAACSPLAVQGTKDAIIYSRDHGVHAGLAYEAQKNAALLPCEDVMEAFAAFMEKRAPNFKGK